MDCTDETRDDSESVVIEEQFLNSENSEDSLKMNSLDILGDFSKFLVEKLRKSIGNGIYTDFDAITSISSNSELNYQS